MIADTIPKKAKSKSSRLPAPMSDEQFDSRVEAALWKKACEERADMRREAMATSREACDPQMVVQIPLASIARHPLNRTIDPRDPEIVSLATSIAEHGQLEPLRVRRLSFDPTVPNYQLISGERRYTALQHNGAMVARCIVVDADDATALAEVAVANAHRQDLNPIERAELMQHLIDAGRTLQEAGHVFGLTSDSGCKNALRILKLPGKIRELVISGQMPERVARRLVPYAVAAKLMNAIADELTHKAYGDEAMVSLLRSSDQPYFIGEAIARHTRPISADLMHRYPYPLGEHPCLFDWTEHEQALQIVELPFGIGHDHKNKCDIIEPRTFAQNVKLWDKLNEPLVKAAAEQAKTKKSSDGKGSSSAFKPKALSPAEQKADDKRKAAEAERRLDTFTRDWLGRLIRCTLASRSSQDELVALTLPWLVGQCAGHDLRQAHQQALTECQIQPSKSKDRIGMDALFMLPIAAKNPTQRFDVLNAFWRVLLWPVSNLIGDEAKRSTLTPAGELPDKLIPIGYSTDNLVELAALGSVSAETAWHAGATDGSDERRLISVWLCRHTKAQLQKLRLELNVIEGSETMGRDELAGCVLNAHRPGKPLNLPKRLARKSK